jgi:hypothetical protein
VIFSQRIPHVCCHGIRTLTSPSLSARQRPESMPSLICRHETVRRRRRHRALFTPRVSLNRMATPFNGRLRRNRKRQTIGHLSTRRKLNHGTGQSMTRLNPTLSLSRSQSLSIIRSSMPWAPSMLLGLIHRSIRLPLLRTFTYRCGILALSFLQPFDGNRDIRT